MTKRLGSTVTNSFFHKKTGLTTSMGMVEVKNKIVPRNTSLSWATWLAQGLESRM